MPKEPGIRLHPTKGLNAHLAACQQCGKEYGVALLGNNDSVPDYQTVYHGLCTDCEEEMKKFKDVVDAGGVYWKCADCKRRGVLLAQSDLAQDVRKTMGIQPPEPCGVEFSHDNCPACFQDEEKPDGTEATPE
jgi:hypothetical protein